MKFFCRSYGHALKTVLLVVALSTGTSFAQDYSSMGITDLVASADRMLQRWDYRGAIPALKEVINRTAPLTDPQGKETCQTCRFQLARAYYRVGDAPAGVKVLDEYLANEPRKRERMALRMMAQGFFDTEEWDKIEEISSRLLGFPDLEKEDLYNANLLLGQARFRLEKWAEAVEPLAYAADYAKDPHVEQLCQIMVVRALVEAENWRQLFGWVQRVYRTEAKYDITLNLTLMKAGRARFEDEDFLNALLLYRMVLPREKLLDHADKRIASLSAKLDADVKRGIPESDIQERRNEIDDIRESQKVLRDLPAYEDEVTFRIGQIYAEVKRYWEGYVLFDKLYQNDRVSEIGEASMLQSVLILYDIGQVAKAEKRILLYLQENPDGRYARTLLTMLLRDNLVKQNFNRVTEMRDNIEVLPQTDDSTELELQSDLNYMLAFGYFQKQDYKAAGEQFGVIIDNYPQSSHFGDSIYYRGMTYMMQANYAMALKDFQKYQTENEYGEHLSASLFREGVCRFGLEEIAEAEAVFSRFIEKFPEDVLVSEAYSMRGDIEAAKEATNEDPYTLDRALADYRKGIDKATTSMQASYAAFQAAKVYKLEYKWQEIIDLMNYYQDRWEEQADVAESTFWKGQAQIELGQVDEAVTAYLDAIERFGNEAEKNGVDKIIHELVSISNVHLSEGDRDSLSLRVKLKLTNIDPHYEVLRLRLQVTQVLLEGEDIAAAFGAELLEDDVPLKLTTPASLALMCDAAADMGDVEQMKRLSEYFIGNFEESDLLWHAYRAKTFMYLAEENYKDVLWSIDEAQGMFGAEPHMGWAQIIKADTEFKMGRLEEAEASYNMILGVPEWRGPLFAEAMFGMGNCAMAAGDLEKAHSFYQRVYLLFKSYSDGDWAAKGYLAAADVLKKMGREEDAVKTLQAMLEDVYTNTNPLAEQVRLQLKKYEGQ
ncbi:tetratricopeptide repeat protein [Pontiella agarivorans]|uniref:Tetratricopeptide repeat protein n=1 Tax=Pontiella agarivorans TaxID=3038953 RepID=A0ABU5N100_9BACT|nr:tetratricopeptide repeat protein [Pontiella agarivorans]MDZ8120112.1 tetratricopeptide repeat protein [Pontiella agarivorans]